MENDKLFRKTFVNRVLTKLMLDIGYQYLILLLPISQMCLVSLQRSIFKSMQTK